MTGLCAQSPLPDLWFSDDPGETAIARTICAECPIAEKCFEDAVLNGERHGVWGGRGEDELRARTRGLRRRATVAVVAA